jgi:ATP-binding cassette subfamily F protein uup
MAVLVDLRSITVRHGDRLLLDDLSIAVADGDRLGVVGINGTGKSTLLRVLAGVDSPPAGEVSRGRGVRVGYLEQEPSLPPGSAKQAVGPGWQASAALERLGMGPEANTDVAALSGGQTKRVALARVLAHPAELLVLDEPTNHLDLASIAWLEKWLLDYRGGLVLVTHDRHLLDKVTTRMLELDRGHGYMHEGGYAAYLAARASREDQAASAESSRRNLARRELAWLRRGAPARTRKPRSRIDQALRTLNTGREPSARSGDLEMTFGTPRLGDKVIECENVSYRYDAASRWVLSGIDLSLSPRDRLAIVGANGTGKTTLLDILAARRQPTKGAIDVGPTVVVGYYDQTGIDLDPDARVRDLVAGSTRVPGTPEDVALMNRFWFSGSLQYVRSAELSGGERRRLQLLLILAARPNVLLLDEPTNDLDLDTLRILEDFLEDWPGALVAVSHDRTFLDRATDSLMALDDRGNLEGVAGGLAAFIARAEQAGLAPPNRAPESTSEPGGPTAGRRRPSAPGADLPPPGRPKSASTIGRQLRDAEKEVARLSRRTAELTEALEGTAEHAELARIGLELAEVHARLNEAENRWLEIAQEAENAR